MPILHLISVGVDEVTAQLAAPGPDPILTGLSYASLEKPRPVIVTRVPPEADPTLGEIPVTSPITWKSISAILPSAMVDTMSL
jgi:hypothetical protein